MKKTVLEAAHQISNDIREATVVNPKDKIGSKKPSLGVLPVAGLEIIVPAMEDGMRKYGPYNWRDINIGYMTYLHAILRHTFALIEGENVNSDNEAVHHLGSIGANIMILADAIKNNSLTDDRHTVKDKTNGSSR